jgi:hypothetical protein
MKYIVYQDSNDSSPKIHKEYEDNVPLTEISKLKFIWYFLTNKRFVWKLTETIKYALRHHDCYRGNGSSEVYLFTKSKEYKKMWRA